MGAAAELGRPALDVHHADHLTVLFAKQSHGPQLLGFLHRHLLHGDVHGVEDLIVDDLLHPCQFLGGHGAEVGKVEVGDGGILIGTCLMHMVAQHLTQGSLQQVGSGVVAGNGHAVALVHLCGQHIAHLHNAAFQHAGVDVVALGGLFHVQHAQAALGAVQHAVVCSLTAHLSVEGGLIQHHQHAVLCFLVGGNGIGQGLFIAQCHNGALVGQSVVAGKDGGLGFQCAEQILAPAGDVLLQTLGAGALLLLLHLCVEAVLVDLQTLLGGDLLGQIQREAEGIVQLEGVHAAQQLLVCLLQTVDHVVQDVHAGIDGAGKVCFLGTDDLLDIGVMLAQLGVSGLAGLDDSLHQIHEEGVVDAQHPAVAGSAAQQTAQHIAAALVGGQDAVRHHKGAAADVVGCGNARPGSR